MPKCRSPIDACAYTKCRYLVHSQIFLAVTSFVVVLVLEVIFVLMAFCAWGEEDIFRVMVSSSVIAGSGGGITAGRSKAAGEVSNDTDLDDIVAQIQKNDDLQDEDGPTI